MTPRPHSEIYIAACSSEERGGIWHCRLDGDELRTYAVEDGKFWSAVAEHDYEV